MINKALHKKQDFFTLSFSAVGAIIGFTLLLVTVQLHSDAGLLFGDKSEALDPDYLVIKKQISDLNTLGLNKNSNFTEEEIEDFKNQSFVKELAPFKNGNFEVMATMGLDGGNFPAFRTLAFFESIPDQFIDAETSDWEWQEGSSDIPIILPNTFLDAYNFGIAPATGSPQASKNIISSFKFKLDVEGNGKRDIYYGNVIDFSDRINSILVPENFLNYANEKYGYQKQKNPSRLIISTLNTHDPKLIEYLEENALETNKEQLRGGKVEQILRGFLNFHIAIGIVIILLAALLFVLYGKVLIQKSKYEISLLFILGYNFKQINKPLILTFVKMFALIGAISFSCFLIVKLWFNSWLKEQLTIDITSSVSWTTIITGVLFLSLFFVISSVNIRKLVQNIAKPNS